MLSRRCRRRPRWGLRTLFFAAALAAPLSAAAGPNLGNTFQLLRDEKRLMIGYIGGSVTQGDNATNYALSWRSLTTKWFQQRYPDAEVREVNAALSGTGSDLGAMRTRQDLLSGNPDLVFIEFAVNDYYMTTEHAQRGVEGIVRQIRRQNPRADIVLVQVTRTVWAPDYDAGQLPVPVRNQMPIASRYGLPVVNVGQAIHEHIRATGASYSDFFSDVVHPNNAGHAQYAATLQAFLADREADAPAGKRGVPPPVVSYPFDYGAIEDPRPFANDDWQFDDLLVGRLTRSRLRSDVIGASLTFPFEGSAAGLYWILAPDAGDILWSLDGSAPRKASAYLAGANPRWGYLWFADTLGAGPHELTLTVAQGNPASRGNMVRIAGFLTNRHPVPEPGALALLGAAGLAAAFVGLRRTRTA